MASKRFTPEQIIIKLHEEGGESSPRSSLLKQFGDILAARPWPQFRGVHPQNGRILHKLTVLIQSYQTLNLRVIR